MSDLTYITQRVADLTNLLNQIIDNGKKIPELDQETTLTETHNIAVNDGTATKRITIQQLIGILGIPPALTDYVSKANGGQFDGAIQVSDGTGIINLGDDGTFTILSGNAPNANAFRINSSAGVNFFQYRALPQVGGSGDSSWQAGWTDDPNNVYFDGVAQNAFNGLSGTWWVQFWQPNTLISVGTSSGTITGSEQGDKLRVYDGKFWVDGEARAEALKILTQQETIETDAKTLKIDADGSIKRAINVPATNFSPEAGYSGSQQAEVIDGVLHLHLNITATGGTFSGTGVIAYIPSQFRYFKNKSVPFASLSGSASGYLLINNIDGSIRRFGTVNHTGTIVGDYEFQFYK